jgi:hypothetical protein
MPDHSSEIRTDTREARVLRTASPVGAVTDTSARLPVLLPSLATRIWSVHGVSGSYRVAMACAASLMPGWTLLLVWASKRPLERRAVAPLTFLVVGGIVPTEVAGAVANMLDAWPQFRRWSLQAILLILFGWAYHIGRPTPRVPEVTP